MLSSYMAGLQLYLHLFYLNWMQRTYSMYRTSGQCINCFILHMCIVIFVHEKKRCKMPHWQCAVRLLNQLNCHHISDTVSSICRHCEHSLQPLALLPPQTSTLLNFFKLDTTSKNPIENHKTLDTDTLNYTTDQSSSPVFSFLVLLCSVASNHIHSCSSQCNYKGFIDPKSRLDVDVDTLFACEFVWGHCLYWWDLSSQTHLLSFPKPKSS